MTPKSAYLLLFAAFTALTAALGTLMATEPLLGLVIIGGLAMTVVLYRPKCLVILLATLLPFSASVGVAVGPVFIAACDILVAVLIGYWLIIHVFFQKPNPLNSRILRSAIGPVFACVFPYIATAVVEAIVSGHGMSTYLDIFQRAQLTLGWAAAGAVIYLMGLFPVFRNYFIYATLVLSAVWVATPGVGGVLGVQKNPSGGFIAAAFLMMLMSGGRPLVRLPALLLLAAGLVSTGSRGSMVGLAAGVIILGLLFADRRRVMAPLMLSLLASTVAFLSLPQQISSRILSQEESGTYNIEIRQLFVQDALDKFQTSPWLGVGVGNYMQSHPLLQRVETLDPHNVFALTLAEGGYPLFTAFLVMILGPLLWLLLRTRKYSSLAFIVQVSTLVHAYVDVYWVRGTPAVGWLLIGATLALCRYRQEPGKTMVTETRTLSGNRKTEAASTNS